MGAFKLTVTTKLDCFLRSDFNVSDCKHLETSHSRETCQSCSNACCNHFDGGSDRFDEADLLLSRPIEVTSKHQIKGQQVAALCRTLCETERPRRNGVVKSASIDQTSAQRQLALAIRFLSIALIATLLSQSPGFHSPITKAQAMTLPTEQAAAEVSYQSDFKQLDFMNDVGLANEVNRDVKFSGIHESNDARQSNATLVNISNVFEVIFKKRPYSKYWTVEQKWNDLFKRLMSVQGAVRQMMAKNFMRDVEYYADLTISAQCEKDLKYIQNYGRQSTNFRWLAHIVDSTGKSEPGMLTGMLAHLGHPVQCIKVRAPARPSNESFDERFFEKQTAKLGERFRGKYCLVSVRPVLPPRPHLVSRFSKLMNESLLSNISYAGEPTQSLKMRARQMSVPMSAYEHIDRRHLRLDQVPFESELYQYLIAQRNFMFTLPRFMGVCYPSSCTRDDIRISIQKTLDDQHQVVDIEFECEQEEVRVWDFFTTPRLVAYVILSLLAGFVFFASLTRYILLSKLQIKRSRLAQKSKLASLLIALDMFSVDKCAGILFVKMKRASPLIDWTKVENNRSTTIDALKGFLILILIYSQMTVLGLLPLPFMWSKWSEAMFPFFRSLFTQPFINLSIWSEAFYIISAYLIGLKYLENLRPRDFSPNNQDSGLERSDMPKQQMKMPKFFGFIVKRYVRLVMPLVAFILLNYVWPRLSNGFVFQDQANKLMKPCDTYGWTNLMLFHNHFNLNETCLWPSHVSASFFQLHLISYPLIALCLMTLSYQTSERRNEFNKIPRLLSPAKLFTYATFGLMASLAAIGLVYPALKANENRLIVPLLIDYLDYDNYGRVLEWMVLPTYNHLTSYIIGLALALIVVQRKSHNEWLRYKSLAHWLEGAHNEGNLINDGSSSSSIRSSSTQELHEGLTFKVPQSSNDGDDKSEGNTTRFYLKASSEPQSMSIPNSRVGYYEYNSASTEYDEDIASYASLDATWASSASCGPGILWRLVLNSISCFLLVGSLISSWFWNGLGQPMSETQTFCYVALTKLAFSLSFAYLFKEHIATRRNSSNPWMLTRFLVPIGRMSLTVFYLSWLVIWFDLLSSLHQWHPSHYFIFEKYTEIIFITLVVGMFVYGAFEGIIKRIQYTNRTEQVKRDSKLISEARSLETTISYIGDKDTIAGWQRHHLTYKQAQLRVKPFEFFFEPFDRAYDCDDVSDQQRRLEGTTPNNSDKLATSDNIDSHSQGKSTLDSAFDKRFTVFGLQQQFNKSSQRLAPGDSRRPAERDNLSPRSQFELNAELRANNSFASIGLYENAGATSDLSVLNTSSSQASPMMSQLR